VTRELKPSPDFDFFMDVWRCRHRYLARRLAGCREWLEFGGHCAARKILGGFGNTDESDIQLPGGPYRGMSLRIYDPCAAKWSIYWLDSRRPGTMSPPVVGTFTDGVGTFYGEDVHENRRIRVRYLWSVLSPQAARWEQAFSPDQGDSWETNWTMDFTRV
jgi:hypothetical protein